MTLLLPLILSAAIPLTIFFRRHNPQTRDAISIGGALLTFLALLILAIPVFEGERPTLTLLTLSPSLSFALHGEPLGLLFALTATLLWSFTSLYAASYLRLYKDPHQTRFFVFFALAIFSTIGITLSANLLTLFLFYEILTLTTLPLVMHRGDTQSRNAGKTYLFTLMGTSLVFFTVAIAWTWNIADTLDFRSQGILSDTPISSLATGLLLGLFAFGIGKSALMPLHRWLPAAMVAPAPVSALLHAVAVVKAGVFSMLKICVYIFGPSFLTFTGASIWLIWFASITLVLASLIALTQQNLKARLAYSTISQLAAVTLGAAIASPLALAAAALYIITHSFAKITLFMGAGAIDATHHLTSVSSLHGLGRAMPFTCIAFLIAALSLTGFPPTGGMWSKIWLAQDAPPIAVIALALSTLLNAAYLLPVGASFFFAPPTPQTPSTRHEAPWPCVLVPCCTAAFCVLLFFFSHPLLAIASSALQ